MITAEFLKMKSKKSRYGVPAPAGQSEKESTVTVEFPGARLTPMYVITQPVGTGKKGPVERWIERAVCQSAEATGNGVRATLSRKALKTRGIDVNDLIDAKSSISKTAQ